jgi:hypothetical protein
MKNKIVCFSAANKESRRNYKKQYLTPSNNMDILTICVTFFEYTTIYKYSRKYI